MSPLACLAAGGPVSELCAVTLIGMWIRAAFDHQRPPDTVTSVARAEGDHTDFMSLATNIQTADTLCWLLACHQGNLASLKILL